MRVLTRMQFTFRKEFDQVTQVRVPVTSFGIPVEWVADSLYYSY